jgi:hypothetical protein
MSIEIIQTVITTVGTIVVALITVVVKTKLDQHYTSKNAKKEENITEADVQDMVLVQEWLENFRAKYEYERASIFQFHNGGKFFQGKSMKKFSMTYEAAAPGYEKIKRFQQNVLTSEYPRWVNRMMNDTCFVTTPEDVDFKDKKELEKLGIIQFVTVPIYCLNNTLIGFIVGHIMVENDYDVMSKSNDMIEDSKQIAGYIANTTGK